jgi:Fe-S-cluster containining protein
MRGDRELIQIVDAAMAESSRRAGAWLKCRIGCTECCIGVFAITPLDAGRLRRGLAETDRTDPGRVRRIRERAQQSWERLRRDYPDDTLASLIEQDEAGEDEPCPALDPETGACELYAWRPITCRTFGPPLRFGDESLAVCELCFDGATPEEVAACEVEIEADGMEEQLLAAMEGGDTIVALALAG